MSYAISGGERFNVVVTHPNEPEDAKEKPMDEVLERMRSFFAGWDPWYVQPSSFYISPSGPRNCIQRSLTRREQPDQTSRTGRFRRRLAHLLHRHPAALVI
jgi:hypothetical protein